MWYGKDTEDEVHTRSIDNVHNLHSVRQRCVGELRMEYMQDGERRCNVELTYCNRLVSRYATSRNHLLLWTLLRVRGGAYWNARHACHTKQQRHEQR